ncbi:hypothetical protein Pcinc_008280 [Petrolisthes cinctipes]|uniref:Uncharacterized protein n=1 Tax=Petrolisthes cinctipes TaxID=88211 RepID=A0AAE1KWK1_PETCI|nr:hypothetical protein Pcinc_008280 [Petrolisthes cinctipes]
MLVTTWVSWRLTVSWVLVLSILRDSTPNLFAINPTSGIVSLDKPVHFEEMQAYNFTVLASSMVLPEGLKEVTLPLAITKQSRMVKGFLNVPVDESPTIPFSILRRFVSGSPAAGVSVAGDIFGPTSPPHPTQMALLLTTLKFLRAGMLMDGWSGYTTLVPHSVLFITSHSLTR